MTTHPPCRYCGVPMIRGWVHACGSHPTSIRQMIRDADDRLGGDSSHDLGEPPLVQGGQGRSADEQLGAADAILWCVVICGALWCCIAAVVGTWW